MKSYVLGYKFTYSGSVSYAMQGGFNGIEFSWTGIPERATRFSSFKELARAITNSSGILSDLQRGEGDYFIGEVVEETPPPPPIRIERVL